MFFPPDGVEKGGTTPEGEARLGLLFSMWQLATAGMRSPS